jgi:hypothetical protein
MGADSRTTQIGPYFVGKTLRVRAKCEQRHHLLDVLELRFHPDTKVFASILHCIRQLARSHQLNKFLQTQVKLQNTLENVSGSGPVLKRT